MGSYRYLLALMVLVSHSRLRMQGIEIGAVAVISFIILSGYVMTRLVDRHYAAPERWTLFYLDRAARLFPQFLFYLSITVVLVSQRWISFGYAAACEPGDVVLNALALPLSWAVPLGLRCHYLPQAWSLGLELSFYLLVPCLLWSPSRARVAVALSVACFAAALCRLIDLDTFAYRTLPGTLLMFAVGMAFARPALFGRWFPYLVGIAAAMLVLGVRDAPWSGTIGHSVLIGLAFGVPLVAMLRHLRSGVVDEWLGNLSYGLFLNHLLIMNVSEQVLGVAIDTPAALLALIAAATLTSVVTFRVIEQPFLNWRRGLRDAATGVAQLHAVQAD